MKVEFCKWRPIKPRQNEAAFIALLEQLVIDELPDMTATVWREARSYNQVCKTPGDKYASRRESRQRCRYFCVGIGPLYWAYANWFLAHHVPASTDELRDELVSFMKATASKAHAASQLSDLIGYSVGA